MAGFVCEYCVADQLVEFVGLPCRAAGEKSVDRGLHNQFFGVPGIYASAVKYRNISAGFSEDFQKTFLIT